MVDEFNDTTRSKSNYSIDINYINSQSSKSSGVDMTNITPSAFSVYDSLGGINSDVEPNVEMELFMT